MNLYGFNQSYKLQSPQTKPQLKFKGNKFYTLEEVNKASMVSPKDVKEGVEKLTKKIKFLNEILKENDKTKQPVTAKIGDTHIFIDMDKTTKGKTKINLFADTKRQIYEPTNILDQFKKIDNPYYIRQKLNIVISNKDGRMSEGSIKPLNGTYIHFERNNKTGKRDAISKYFSLIPNVRECFEQNQRTEYFGQDKTSIIINNIFFKIFSDLSLIKPKIRLTK